MPSAADPPETPLRVHVAAARSESGIAATAAAARAEGASDALQKAKVGVRGSETLHAQGQVGVQKEAAAAVRQRAASRREG